MDLTVCSILRDEQDNVPDWGACLPLEEVEVVAVDTGSRDATPALLRGLGLHVHHFQWCDDFAAARNHSLGLAARGWILWLDADDRLGPGQWQVIRGLLHGPPRAYRFLVRSPRESGRGEVFRQIRLFPNGLGLRFEGRVHEQLATSAARLGIEVHGCGVEIRHLGYATEARRRAKRERNLRLLREEAARHPHDPVVVMEWGNCLVQSGRPEEGLKAYFSLVGETPPPEMPPPKDEVMRLYPELIADTLDRLNRPGAAESWYRLALRWEPEAPKAAYWLGKRALASGDLEGALALLGQAAATGCLPGRVARDFDSARRNALALLVLCLIRKEGPRSPAAAPHLDALLAGGLEDLPLDPRIPLEYFRATGRIPRLEDFCREYLGSHPASEDVWLDYLELLLVEGKYTELLTAHAQWRLVCPPCGAGEALAGKAREALGEPAKTVYRHYFDALRRFPSDPTLLVYFSDWVNANRLYPMCYNDLRALPSRTAELESFVRQMEQQGLVT